MSKQPQLWVIVQGDLAPDLVTVLNNGTEPQNLTGCTIQFRMKGLSTGTIVSGNASIEGDPLNGKVRYSWVAPNTDVADRYVPEYRVTFPSGKIQTWPNEDVNYIVVRARRTT